ncbi:MAG: ATP-binding cassette domain-containing protein, partial [Anaerolineales bacterium]|nr:ATP-binding cassette domain-containing protein [Anaerolineales bacterium]
MNEYLLEMQGITKEFPGVKALDDVTFSVRRGEIHALVGENGAGKSTLMKVLSGVYPSGTYQGKILMNGVEQQFRSIRESEEAGVAIIYQELALVKQLSVMENISLGAEITRAGVIQSGPSYQRAQKALAQVGLPVNPATQVSHLGVGEQQLVEIAKALSKEARILILDEPTAALAEGEAANLIKILKHLRETGVTCVYISHRLKEVFDLADRITVLRDGKTVATHEKKDLDEKKLISLMVGRDLADIYPHTKREPGDVLMEVKDWTVFDSAINRTIAHVNLTLRKNEILGIAGLIGAGRTELMMSLFNVWGRRVSGALLLNGRPVALGSASDAIRAGISLASEDRKRYGLVLA